MGRNEKKYILFSDRGFNFLIWECFFLALGLSILLCLIFEYHWALAILTTIIFAKVILRFFEANKIFRYIISGCFVGFWTYLAYCLAATFEPDAEISVFGIVMAIIVCHISIRTHKNAFYWMSNVYDRS